jgi:hypothetical protein
MDTETPTGPILPQLLESFPTVRLPRRVSRTPPRKTGWLCGCPILYGFLGSICVSHLLSKPGRELLAESMTLEILIHSENH